jgi:NAD(P)-dependent dehydrogenase (short-subunit alcohol dehydrogenase family)
MTVDSRVLEFGIWNLEFMNIVITGASRGIGFEAARLFAENTGNKVFALSRNKEGLEKLEADVNNVPFRGRIMVWPFDLMNGDIRKELLPVIEGFIPSVDVLVNNAGLLVAKPFEQLSPEEFDMMFNANVKSAFLISQALLPLMRLGSHIVNIGSMGGFQGSVKFSGLSLYSASKGALAILSECMAEELKDRNISVNCLALGSAQTEMLSQAFPGYKAPLSAADMARFIVEFATSGNRWCNGKVLPVSISTP